MKVLFIGIFLIMLRISGFGQDIKISDLKAPSSPAFTILGIQPNDISRPKTFNALETSILSAIKKNDLSTIPKDLAIEVMPYWLKSNNITFEQMEKKTDIFRNLSVSVGTSQRTNAKDSTNKISQLGFGVRTLFLQGKLKNIDSVKQVRGSITAIFNIMNFYQNFLRATKDSLNNFKDTTDAEFWKNKYLNLVKLPVPAGKKFNVAREIFKLISVKEEDRKEVLKIYAEVIMPLLPKLIVLNKDDIDVFIAEIREKLDKYYNTRDVFIQQVEKIRKYRKDRVGLIIEGAFAVGLEAGNNKYDRLKTGRVGGWVTTTYRPESQIVDFIFLTRWLYDDTELQSGHSFDFGTRFVYDNNKFNCSAEILYRSSNTVIKKEMVGSNIMKLINSKSGWRYGVNFDYRINEKMSLSYTFGKTFKNDSFSQGELISTLGINLGFGAPILIKQ